MLFLPLVDIFNGPSEEATNAGRWRDGAVVAVHAVVDGAGCEPQQGREVVHGEKGFGQLVAPRA